MPYSLLAQRKFVNEQQKSKEEGKLYEYFATWIKATYGTEPTATEWGRIMEEDCDEDAMSE